MYFNKNKKVLFASGALNSHSLSQAAVQHQQLQKRRRVVNFRWQTRWRQQQVKSDEFKRCFNFAVMDHACGRAAPPSFLHRHTGSQCVTQCRPRLAGDSGYKQANKLAEWLLETVRGRAEGGRDCAGCCEEGGSLHSLIRRNVQAQIQMTLLVLWEGNYGGTGNES